MTDAAGRHDAYHALVAECTNNPATLDGWFKLGHFLHTERHWSAAAAAFKRHHAALKSDAVDGWTLTNIGWNLHLTDRWAEAENYLRHAIKIAPRLALPHTNLSQVLIAQGRFDEALIEAQRGIALGDGRPEHYVALAFAHFGHQEWREGFAAFEARVRFKFPEFDRYPFPRWDGTPTDCLFIQAEQGFGDTIMGLRWLHLAAQRATSVIFYCQRELRSWLQANVPNNVTCVATPAPLPSASSFSPLFSLPVCLDLSVSDLTRCLPTPSLLDSSSLSKPRGERPRVALCWAGSASHDFDRHRSIPFAAMLRLLEVSDFDFVSLQSGPRAADIGDAGTHGLVRDLSPQITNFADTARELAQCDLLISCDTAIAHLAGALGIETWLLLGNAGVDWRWSGQDDGFTKPSIWYPSVYLLRRFPSASWEAMLENVASSLRESRKQECLSGPVNAQGTRY